MEVVSRGRLAVTLHYIEGKHNRTFVESGKAKEKYDILLSRTVVTIANVIHRMCRFESKMIYEIIHRTPTTTELS